MKKILALWMVLTVAVLCCACGGKEDDADKQEATESYPVTYTLSPDAQGDQKVDATSLNAAKKILEARLAGTGTEYSVALDEKTKQFTVTCMSNLETDLLTRKGVVAFVHPVTGMPVINNSDIKSAEVQYDDKKKEHYALIIFTDEGKTKFKDLTRSSVGKSTEVYIDSEMICAPTVYAPITDGKVEIHGDFSEQKAVTVANLLNCDAMPFALTITDNN